MPYLSLLPIAAYFVIGLVLRHTGLAQREHAGFLFRLVLNVTLPALIFLSIAGATLDRQALLLPVAGLAVNALCTGAAVLAARSLELDAQRTGAMVLGACVTNLLFTFPFIEAVLGPAGLAQAFLYDIGNAVYFATVAHALAWHYGGEGRHGIAGPLLRTLRAPIFIAIAAALLVNAAGWTVPQLAHDILAPLGACTTPLVLIAVGLVFSARGVIARVPFFTVLLRMPLGLAVGLALVWLLGLQGLTAAVVVVCAVAPIGFNSVTLAATADLDAEQAAAALSLSIAVAMLTTTGLLLLAARWLGLST